jgi:DNA-binding response OmpR family regulator
VDVAAAGDEAHTMLTERGYDLIILELNLPKLYGLQILCKVRNIGGISTPILVLTQRSDIRAISGTTPILMSRA